MSQFDTAPAKTGDTFVRHNPKYLNMFYGTKDVTPLWVADMDLPIAAPITQALQHVTDRAQYAYEFNSEGVFDAITGWFKRRHALTLDPANFVQFPGVLTALSLLVRELTQPDEGVLIQLPAYHQFQKLVTSAGRRVVPSPLKSTNGTYTMDYDDLEAKLRQPDVTAMILCNPHNPTGRVWTKVELEQVVTIANRHNVTIVSDEVHADILLSGHPFTSLSSIDGGRHVSLIGSPAKTFGMHSISDGYLYTANQALLKTMKDLVDSMYLGHGNAFTTHATIAAFEHGDAWLDEFLTYLEGTVDWVDHFLKTKLPGVRMTPAEGTYQIWLDCSATGLDAETLKRSLGTAGFGATPGTWFDATAHQFIRVNLAAPRDEIKSAFKRFKDVLDQEILKDVRQNRQIPAKENQGCC